MHKVSLQPRSQKGVEEKRRIAEGPSAGPAVAQGCKTCCHAQAVIGRAWRPACRPEEAGRSGGTSAGLRGAIIGLSNLPIMISMSRTMLECSKQHGICRWMRSVLGFAASAPGPSQINGSGDWSPVHPGKLQIFLQRWPMPRPYVPASWAACAEGMCAQTSPTSP